MSPSATVFFPFFTSADLKNLGTSPFFPPPVNLVSSLNCAGLIRGCSFTDGERCPVAWRELKSQKKPYLNALNAFPVSSFLWTARMNHTWSKYAEHWWNNSIFRLLICKLVLLCGMIVSADPSALIRAGIALPTLCLLEHDEEKSLLFTKWSLFVSAAALYSYKKHSIC